jgi:hypothetical protein
MPTLSSTQIEPVTLYHLLTRQIPNLASTNGLTNLPSLPSLEQRCELTFFASTLYTFILARWHHKRCHSSSVFFLLPNGVNPCSAVPDRSRHYIGGFVVNRPGASMEIFLPGVPDKEVELQLHPDLMAQAPHKSPRFKTAFDIYSFGLLLAEIGCWNTLHAVALGRQRIKQPSWGTWWLRDARLILTVGWVSGIVMLRSDV